MEEGLETNMLLWQQKIHFPHSSHLVYSSIKSYLILTSDVLVTWDLNIE